MENDKLFDRKLGALVGVPDVLSTKPTTIQTATPMVGDALTFIVQTYRQTSDDPADKGGDWLFIQCVDAGGAVRLCIPPAVAACIARQHKALTGMSRRRGAQAAADDRAARGVVPGFMRRRRRGA
jgi:hypothetical protein